MGFVSRGGTQPSADLTPSICHALFSMRAVAWTEKSHTPQVEDGEAFVHQAAIPLHLGCKAVIPEGGLGRISGAAEYRHRYLMKSGVSPDSCLPKSARLILILYYGALL